MRVLTVVIVGAAATATVKALRSRTDSPEVEAEKIVNREFKIQRGIERAARSMKKMQYQMEQSLFGEEAAQSLARTSRRYPYA